MRMTNILYLLAVIIPAVSGFHVAFQTTEDSMTIERAPVMSMEYAFNETLKALEKSNHNPSRYDFLDSMSFECGPDGRLLDYRGTTKDQRMRYLYDRMKADVADVYVASKEDCDLMSEAAAGLSVPLIVYDRCVIERDERMTNYKRTLEGDWSEQNCKDINPDLDGKRFPTLLSLMPAFSSQAEVLALLLKTLDVTNVAILYSEVYSTGLADEKKHTGEIRYFLTDDDREKAETTKKLLEKSGIATSGIYPIRAVEQSRFRYRSGSKGSVMLNAAEIVMQTYLSTRVYIALGRLSQLEFTFPLDQLLNQQLSRMGLMQTGEFAIISVQNPSDYMGFTGVKSVDFGRIFAKANYDSLEKRLQEDEMTFSHNYPHAGHYYYAVEDDIRPGLANYLLIIPHPASPEPGIINGIVQGISALRTLDIDVLSKKYGLPNYAYMMLKQGFFNPNIKTQYDLTFHVRLTDAIKIIVECAVEFADATGTNPFRNATGLAQWCRGRSHKGLLETIEIDENGFVKARYTVAAFSRDLGKLSSNEIRNVTDAYQANPMAYDAAMQAYSWLYEKPLDRPRCGFFGELCPVKTPDRSILYMAIGAGCAVLLLIAAAYGVYRMYKFEKDLLNLKWIIPKAELRIQDTVRSLSVAQNLSVHSLSSARDLGTSTADIQTFERNLLDNAAKSKRDKLGGDDDLWANFEHSAIAIRDKSFVYLTQVYKDRALITREVRKELKLMKDLNCENLVKFHGCVYEPPIVALVTDFCSRGSLQNIIDDDAVTLDNLFHASIIFDIIKGMEYLTKSKIGFHGRLKSTNCMVDSRWQVKLSGFGLWEFRSDESDPFDPERSAKEKLWTAPELLREEQLANGNMVIGNLQGDSWSFGIILHELFGRAGLYGSDLMDPIEAIEKLKHPTETLFRPDMGVLADTPKTATRVIEMCLAEDPQERPSFGIMKKLLKPLKKGLKSNILDNMAEIMERYTNNLEDVVQERTQLLEVERKKTERLLLQLLPAPVAEQLKRGEPVEAENYPAVTIYFSDIVGFTSLSSQSTPLQIVEFLNDLYVLFDSVSASYNVYKVETIGDAYMVVSGLPEQNGDLHAGEITSMALSLLDGLAKFKIRHRPNDQLRLRIGLHTGSCVSGVVGLRMPRYCLFGETVTTAAKMESSGEAMKIHISRPCKDILDKMGGYKIIERGSTDVLNNKKPMLTYWVTGEDKAVRQARLAGAVATHPHMKKYI